MEGDVIFTMYTASKMMQKLECGVPDFNPLPFYRVKALPKVAAGKINRICSHLEFRQAYMMLLSLSLLWLKNKYTLMRE